MIVTSLHSLSFSKCFAISPILSSASILSIDIKVTGSCFKYWIRRVICPNIASLSSSLFSNISQLVTRVIFLFPLYCGYRFFLLLVLPRPSNTSTTRVGRKVLIAYPTLLKYPTRPPMWWPAGFIRLTVEKLRIKAFIESITSILLLRVGFSPKELIIWFKNFLSNIILVLVQIPYHPLNHLFL